MNIHAPFAGIVHYLVQPGEQVRTGQALASVEAVKLEAPVVAPGPGVVSRLLVEDFGDVIGGEAVIEVKEA
ncbi:biotin/lipoyl-containing protein [Corynebacterium pseudopelargi]|uniref:Methylmalonyl-CoA carboxyltransferase 1.3S subunit n=1 Tax=Corynebacterium pseudopelargi TaxID=2080757 RepID=A0A3G6IXM3_9CORY|nr:biotin/lipoyl-containing protein [Corynebacterium pseudopelargi]AZA09398.1 Methylmalonyl-CoA carboxyltransferase 1.3S subunit [Corynebacterium pseudopelargi]